VFLNVGLIAVELAVLALLALLLHAWSRRYGLAPLLVFLSGLVVILHTVSPIHVAVYLGTTRLIVSSLVLVPVILMTILVLYEVDGTIPARTAILSIVALSVLVLAFQFVLEIHVGLPGGRNLAELPPDSPLLSRPWFLTACSILAFLGSLLAIVVVYQAMANFLPGIPGWVSSGIALLVALGLDWVLFRLAAFGASSVSINLVEWLAEKGWGGILLWPMMGFYLARVAPGLEGYAGALGRKPLEVIFGSYKAQESNLRISNEERRRAERALEATEIRFRRSFEQAGVGMVHSDSAGNVLMANQAMCEMIGHSEKELISLGWTAITHPDDLPGNIKAVRDLQEGKQDQFEVEKRYLRADGGVVWAHVTVSMVRTETEGESYLIAVVEDITERMGTEAHLRQAQKMEAVGQLTGGIAHDFNNLLTVIMGALELGMDPSAEADEKRDVLKDALTATKRGASLTQRLLAFSRKQTLKPAPLDAVETIKEMRELLVRTLGENIKIRIESGDRVGYCMADQAQFENAVLNLCLNARDAMSNGGELLIRTDRVQVKPEYLPSPEVEPGEYVQVAVADKGTGIPPAHLDKIFEPFFTTKGTGKGSGLGLSMVYGFARQSGGFVTVQSQEGAGTSVQLHLPMA